MRIRRAVAVTALAIVVLAACGDDDTASLGPVTTATSPTTAPSAGRPAPVPEGALELAMTSDDTVPAGPHSWTLELRNTTDQPMTVTFATSQLADVTVLGADGPVHRWSDGRFFQQQLISETIAAGAALPITLDDDLAGVEPGSYDAELTAEAVGAVTPVTVGVLVVAP